MQKETQAFSTCNAYSVDLCSVTLFNRFSKFFGTNRSYKSYFLRMMAIFLIIWVPGLPISAFSGTLNLYLTSYMHYVIVIIYSAGLFLLVKLCQQTSTTILELQEITGGTDDVKFLGFVKKFNNSSSVWFVVCILVPFIYCLYQFFVINVPLSNVPSGPLAYIIDSREPGVFVTLQQTRINSIYFVYKGLVEDCLILGIGFNRFLHYLLVVDNYGKNFLSKVKIDFLVPKAEQIFKPFKKLVVKSTFFVSLAIVLCFSMYLENRFLLHDIQGASFWLTSIVILICIFSFSLMNQMKWIRRALVNAKQAALDNIDEHIQTFRNEMEKESSIFAMYVNLVSFREKVQKASAWAFDGEVISHFFLAVFFPLVGGALTQIVLERIIEIAI